MFYILLIALADAKKPKFIEEKVFTPAETPEFGTCILRVMNARETCQIEAQKAANVCQVQAGLEKASCQIRGGPDAICIARTCSVDEAPCTLLYETGFESCGGTIEVKRVCVKNCGS